MKKVINSLKIGIIVVVIFNSTHSIAQTRPCKYCPSVAEWGGRIEYQPSQKVEVKSDIPYAKYGDRELLLDLYLPQVQTDKKLPVVVIIHGGGWLHGSKTDLGESPTQAVTLVEAGFIVASIDHRMSNEAIFPAAVKDCRAAIQWIKDHSESYGIDKEAIGVFGISSGGHLSLMMGTSHKSTLFESEGTESKTSSQVHAVVAIVPNTDFISLFNWKRENGQEAGLATKFLGASSLTDLTNAREASPLTYVDKDTAPTLIINTAADEVVDFEQGVLFVERCRNMRVPARLFTYSDAPHAFAGWNTWYDETMEMTISYFQEMLIPKSKD
jgi:pectinesterase